MSKDKERIISAIVLKYYKAPEKDDISAPVFKGKRGQPPFTRWTKAKEKGNSHHLLGGPRKLG